MAMERLAEYLQERGRLGDNEMAEKLREHVKNVGDVSVEEVEAYIRGLGREGLTLNSYIVGSIISKALTNYYWDEGTHARLFGTLYKKDPLVVTIRPENGVLVIQKLSEIGEGSHPWVGARTAGLTPNYGGDSSARIDINTEAHPMQTIRRGAADMERGINAAILNIFRRR